MAQYEAPATVGFTRIQQCFLAFIDEVLPKWPILSLEQVFEVFTLHHNSRMPGISCITPRYRMFSFIVAIGSLVAHLRSPHIHGIEQVHRAYWSVYSVYTSRSQDPLVEAQLHALDFLHARYMGLSSQPQFISLAGSVQL